MQTDQRTHPHYETNKWGQPVGCPVNWSPPPRPDRQTLTGHFTRLCLLCPTHAKPLHQLFTAQGEEVWTYMPYGPFAKSDDYARWIEEKTAGQDLFYCINTPQGEPVGVFALASIDPERGSVELAHVMFSDRMKRQPIATEAVYLILSAVFAQGYRRCAWKCNALNLASRQAALRFGFSYEGLFRQALVVKGRNRDTAWFGMTDGDWKSLQTAYRQWLSPDNFDAQGEQRQSLSTLTKLSLCPLDCNPTGTKAIDSTL